MLSSDEMMKKIQNSPDDSIPPERQGLFNAALASVLSASPEQIRDSRVQAKAEKPSPHTRYTYAPAKGRP